MRLLFLLLMMLTLTSCGFHPRGELPLAQPLHNLYLESRDPYGQLAHNLQQYLKASSVHLTDSPTKADTVLVITKEEMGQQLLGVAGTQQTRQYSLSITVAFQITSPTGLVLVPQQAVTESRTIPILANQTLAGSNEANNIYSQMRQAIAYDIMNRLASQDVTTMLVKKP